MLCIFFTCKYDHTGLPGLLIIIIVALWNRANTDIFLNQLIQFYSNNATNLYQLSTHSTTVMAIVLRPQICDVISPYVLGFVFTARRNARIASAVLATAIPSVCLSHAGIVSKRLHVARCSLHCWIAKCV